MANSKNESAVPFPDREPGRDACATAQQNPPLADLSTDFLKFSHLIHGSVPTQAFMNDLSPKRYSTYRLNTVRQNLGGLHLSQVEGLDDECFTANIDHGVCVRVIPDAISNSPWGAPHGLVFSPVRVMVTSFTLISPAISDIGAAQRYHNHRPSQLNRRHPWLTNFFFQAIRFCGTYEHSLTQ